MKNNDTIPLGLVFDRLDHYVFKNADDFDYASLGKFVVNYWDCIKGARSLEKAIEKILDLAYEDGSIEVKKKTFYYREKPGLILA